jgi:hypothetical protein
MEEDSSTIGRMALCPSLSFLDFHPHPEAGIHGFNDHSWWDCGHAHFDLLV